MPAGSMSWEDSTIESPFPDKHGIQAAIRNSANDPYSNFNADQGPSLPPLISAESARLCLKASQAESHRLHKPRSSSECSLLSGPSPAAAMDAALRVLERWIAVLRPQATKEELPHLLAALVHGPPKEVSGRKHDSADRCVGKSVPVPNPTPPANDPLGAALRRAVPEPGSQQLRRRHEHKDHKDHKDKDHRRLSRTGNAVLRPASRGSNVGLPSRGHSPERPSSRASGTGWEFFDDSVKVLDLSDSLHLQENWPDTAERRAMRQSSGLMTRYKAPCFQAKELELGSRPGRRAPLATDLRLRQSGNCSWEDFRVQETSRATFLGNYQARVFNSTQSSMAPSSTPGPGTYSPLRVDEHKGRRAHFNPVGAAHVSGPDMCLPQRGRFVFPKGDPWNPYRGADDF